MKLFVVLLATVAITAASVIDRKNVNVMDDGTVVIRGDNGKLMKIYRQNGMHGQTNIEIEITGPNTMTKMIRIDENNHVSIKNGEGTYYPISRDDMRISQEERSKRSFTFGGGNEVLGNSNLNMRILIDKVGADTTFTKTDTMNSIMYPRIDDLRRMSMIQDNQEFDTKYDQKVRMMMIKVLLRMFDEQVLMQMLNQYGEDQSWNEKVLDDIFSRQGIFDENVMTEIFNNPYLRDMMIKRSILDRSTMEMMWNRRSTLGDMEQLINRQVLKNWMVSVGCCNRNILRQVINNIIFENVVNTGRIGSEWLLQVLNDATLRTMLVHRGIFNVDILEKLMYVDNTNTIHREVLLRQLINKLVLRDQLMQLGFFDSNILNHLMNNEVLGLQVLLKMRFLHKSPTMTYKQLVGMVTNKPVLTMDQMRFGDDLVGITMKKTFMTPVRNMDEILLDINRDRTTPRYGLWNMFGRRENGLYRLGTQGYTNDV